MLHRLIDNVKTTSGVALRLAALAAACAVAIFIATAFLCAAIFVTVLQRYGLPEACLAGAGVFIVLALLATLSYFICKRDARRAALEAESEKSALAAALSDPAMISIALQVARTVGFKRLVPLLAIAGIALGLTAHHRRDSAERSESE